jgi:hypothetical protein
MIEFVTVDGDHVWVSRDKVVMVTGAKTQGAAGGPAVPAIGISMIMVAGAPPLVVQGAPRDNVIKVETGDGSSSSIFSA